MAALLLAMELSGQGHAEERVYALGPVQEVAVLEDFTPDRAAAWQARCGRNVAYTLNPKAALPGVAGTVLAADVRRKDPQNRQGADNWFLLSRHELLAGIVPEELDGIRFLIASHREAPWWISVSLTTSAEESYSTVLSDSLPAMRPVEYHVPLEAFQTNRGKGLSASAAAAVASLSFATNSPDTTLYLIRISAYRREPLRSWLDFTTSHPATHLFQRTDPVEITFTRGGEPMPRASGFRYEVQDYFGRVTAQGAVPFTGARSYTVKATPKTPGYYEVRAFFTDAAGRDLEARSCLRSEGSVPAGLGSFSVLPGTLEENLAMFRRLGAQAFFGLHGDFLGLADYVGLLWRFDYTQWPYLEPTKPDRSSGPAPWAQERLAMPSQPDYRFHLLPIPGNGGVPEWARSTTGRPPPFADWDDYLAMVRDYVRVEKHLYPHQKRRLYSCTWEINLNMPPDVAQGPEYTPQDVVELLRRFRAVVKAEDPEGLVIGPCANVIDPEWYETIFQAGALPYLDGLETHGYCSGTYTPEANDFPGRIKRLNELVRRYNHGRALPIYCTEAGFPGLLGAEVVHRSQAQRMVRLSIILKGEGVRLFLPFYGIDYDQGCFGFLFNREISGPSGPWNTQRVSPKPMVNAMAACVRMLEGAKPRGRITTLGRDVWAYVFERDGATLTAVWTPGQPTTVKLPVGRVRSVELVDILGHSRRVPAAGGRVEVPIDESPVYVVQAIRRR